MPMERQRRVVARVPALEHGCGSAARRRGLQFHLTLFD
jgi:hypothetical protein